MIRIRHHDACARTLAVLLAMVPAAAQTAEVRQAAVAAPASPAAIAQYRRALAEYQEAQAAYAAEAEAYWSLITQKRRERIAKRASQEPLALDDYVLTQPPVYAGPPKPVDPSQTPEEKPPSTRPYVPVVADFLAAAREEFKFVPRQPQSETEFKRAYGQVALAAGLNKATNRPHLQLRGRRQRRLRRAGRTRTRQVGARDHHRARLQPIAGDEFGRGRRRERPPFREGSAGAGRGAARPERAALESKIAILRKMIGVARSVPDAWNEHQALAGTSKGLAIHALNLDVDIGPYLQTQKLMDSVVFARRKGFAETLTAAELEMMNLTGDGNGYDMITMPREWRARVPTANFFQRGGYRDNPVAQRNNVVAKLIAATDAHMDREIRLPGSKELAASLR